MLQKRQRWALRLLLALLAASLVVSLLRMVLHPNWSVFLASVAVTWIIAALLFRLIVERP